MPSELNKDFRKMIQQVGAIVIAVERNGSGHVKVKLQAPDGRTAIQVLPRTASDHRSNLNARAWLRRFMDGREGRGNSEPRT